jgi:hypothetical protein
MYGFTVDINIDLEDPEEAQKYLENLLEKAFSVEQFEVTAGPDDMADKDEENEEN